MGVRDSMDRVAAWFGFGVDDDYYYEDEEEEEQDHARESYANGYSEEPAPTVRRLGRTERSFGVRGVPGRSFRRRQRGAGQRFR